MSDSPESVTVELPDQLATQLEAIAQAEKRSIPDLVVEAIDEYLRAF